MILHLNFVSIESLCLPCRFSVGNWPAFITQFFDVASVSTLISRCLYYRLISLAVLAAEA